MRFNPFSARKPSPVEHRRRISQAVTERLLAIPGVEPVVVETAQIFTVRDFVTAAECRTLMDLIDAGRRPSTLLAKQVEDGFRTSESCDLDRWSPLVQPIDERIAGLLGIDPAFAETLQGQRYGPGQQFKAHHDFFVETESYWAAMKAQGGQRTWTAMIYLNAVEEGGATWFPLAGIRVAPTPGLLLLWNNLRPDGTANPATLHEGMAVVRGAKYIVTKWFREHPWLPAQR